MIGHRAKVMPSAVAERARLTGNCHTMIAITSATARPASEDCQAGRLSTPSINSTTMIGMAATRKDRARLPLTGVNS